MMLYVGLDPGERWCGFAALEITSNDVVRVEARTYSITHRNGTISARSGWERMARDIVGLLPHSRRATIVIEDFQIRAQGHQRFNHGDTLRFIGALQYGLGSVGLFNVDFETPRDPRKNEVTMMFGKAFQRYHSRWPKRHAKEWNHCVSAWRVLGSHLLRHHDSLLAKLHACKVVTMCPEWLPTGSLTPEKDFIAPAAIWQ